MTINQHSHGHASGHAIHARFGIPVVDVEGFSFLDLDEERFVDLIINEKMHGRGGWAITPNCDILRQAHVHPKLRALFHSADAMVADGMSIVWASRLQGTPLQRGRVCGSDLIYSLPRRCAQKGLSIFLLGGVNGSEASAAKILKSHNPDLRIAGSYSPAFGYEKHPEQYEHMRAAIQEAQPDIIFVALGVPKSERLIQEIRASAPDAWWIGVGASFDFVSGVITRAPVFVQKIGFEWVFRMVQDPKRLVRRYLREGLPYAGLMFFNALRRRFAAPRPTAKPVEAPATTAAEKPRIAA
jgi:N-acetylglucosaminyldiphosphoundecaprenol N-acetyl-beta-D-mannosaminyltransferase